MKSVEHLSKWTLTVSLNQIFSVQFYMKELCFLSNLDHMQKFAIFILWINIASNNILFWKGSSYV